MNKLKKLFVYGFNTLLTVTFLFDLVNTLVGLGEITPEALDKLYQPTITVAVFEIILAIAMIGFGVFGMVSCYKKAKENGMLNSISIATIVSIIIGIISSIVYINGVNAAIKEMAEERSRSSTAEAAVKFPVATTVILCIALVLLIVGAFLDYKTKTDAKLIVSGIGHFLYLSILLVNSKVVFAAEGLAVIVGLFMIFTAITAIGTFIAFKFSSQDEKEVQSDDSFPISKLKELKELYEGGLITEEQYNEKSKKFIDMI